MFRIGPQSAKSDAEMRVRNKSARRMRRRLWMLMIMLGLVIASMRQLTQSGTIRRLDQLFGAGEQTTQRTEGTLIFVESESLTLSSPKVEAAKTQPSPTTPEQQPGIVEDPDIVEHPEIVEQPGIVEDVEAEAAETKVPEQDVDEDLAAALAVIEDNSPFRNVETEAWFGLFRRLQKMSVQELEAETLGELTYAQLVKQPNVYRGQVITLHGTVRREELKQLSGNTLGLNSADINSTNIKMYHRLWIEPRGGGTWPFVVHCLELPDGFPRGEKVKTEISVTGYFFKSLSYTWKDGLGLAPLVLARNVDWQPSVAATVRRPITSQNITTVVLIAAAIAAIAMTIVVRNTRRHKPLTGQGKAVTLPDEDAPVESVREKLDRLSAAELKE